MVCTLEHRKIVNQKLWDFANKLDKLNTDIKMCNMLIKDLENPLKAQTIDDMPKGDNGFNSTTENAVLQIERYNMQIQKAVADKENCIYEFNKYISPLKYQYQKVLRERYMNGMSIRKIGYILSYSEKHTERLLGQAQDFLFNYYKHEGF